MTSRSRRDSVGGGVVAGFFRDLQEPTRFSGGGEVAGNDPIIRIPRAICADTRVTRDT